MPAEHDLTQLLMEARSGSDGAFDALLPRVYDQLRELAHLRLSGHRPGATLDTTALVHEAYLRLVDQTQVAWQDRAHFFAVASRAMRFILIDYIRARTAQKRGGPQADLALADVQVAAEQRAADVLALDEALEKLSAVDEQLGRLVEYKFFGGLTYEEIAEVTGRSVRSLKRDWRRARAWLYDMMQDDET